MGAGAWDEAWDEEKDSDEDESESELDDQERHTLQREDQQTVTSLMEDEDEYKEMEALLAAEECRFEPPWPLVNDSVNRNEDEPDEDLPEARRPFQLRGGYEEPLKNDPFFVKFPGMAGHAISNDTEMDTGDTIAENTHPADLRTNNPYAPFLSKTEWEIARWAKLRGPGSTGFSELMGIDGVSQSILNSKKYHRLTARPCPSGTKVAD